jgi:hypothetical protein
MGRKKSSPGHTIYFTGFTNNQAVIYVTPCFLQKVKLKFANFRYTFGKKQGVITLGAVERATH